MKIITMGVYGSTKESFFKALKSSGVDTFCDIRQRRGVRGKKYSYVNATALQGELSKSKINYVHIKELAPSSRVRELQKKSDSKDKVKKRIRKELSETFISEYKKECFSNFSYESFLKSLPKNSKIVCLFCVEREPSACHRSIVADFLALKPNVVVENILP